ncbi:MAG: glycosyltransferase family 4 protein [Firmicutes bacterium]|jgi:glycosyltransferase involved in cell wall biosynthesis|nr:glycosyltransferase family 4 protein [Bacillota bacterium]
MPSLNVLLALMALETGGAETHVVGLAQELKKRGHHVIVASQGGCLEEELLAAEIRHFQVPLNSRAPWDLLCGLRLMIRLVNEYNINLIHAHARIPAWVGHFASLWTRRPLVTTAHGIYSANLGLKALTTWGDQVIAVSEDVRAHLVQNFGVPKDNVTVIPNGVDTTRFAPDVDPGPVLAEFGLSAADPKIVYVSRLSGARGEVALKVIEAVPELLRRHPKLTTFIVGEGDKLPEVERWAEKVNQDFRRPAILVTGARTDTASIIAVATVVIGVGRVILEGMASAKPVVIAGEAGFMGLLTPSILAEAKRHNFSGRGSNQATDAEAITAAVDKVLAQKELAQELGNFGRQVVLQELSLAQMAAQVEEVYFKALRRNDNAAHR